MLSSYRKTLTTLALAVGVLLASCATLQDPEKVKALIADIQKQTAAICQFVPAAADVAALLTGGNATVQTVAIIANAICTAVQQARAAGRLKGRKGEAITVVVDGRVIHGVLY